MIHNDIYIYISYKVSADSRVPSRLFSFRDPSDLGGLSIAGAGYSAAAYLRSGIPVQDTNAIAH